MATLISSVRILLHRPSLAGLQNVYKEDDNMGTIYLVTGVQLSILMSGSEKAPRNRLLRKIIENQFIGESSLSIEEDIKNITEDKS